MLRAHDGPAPRKVPRRRRAALGSRVLRAQRKVPRRRRATLRLVVAAAVIVVGSCSGGDATHSGDLPPLAAESDLDAPYPLASFLSRGADQHELERRRSERTQLVDRLTTECMLAAGFTYAPRNPQPSTNAAPWPDRADPGFAAEYGFGISTWAFRQSQVGELVGLPDDLAEPPPDPNAVYVQSLTDGERAAYYQALHGVEPGIVPQSAAHALAIDSAEGCLDHALQDAEEQLGPEDPLATAGSQFDDQFERMAMRFQSDPRIVQFDNDVRRCMASRGIEWVDESELRSRIQSDVNAIWSEVHDPGQGDLVAASPLLSPRQIDALAGLQEREISLAVELEECGGGWSARQTFVNRVWHSYEQEFVDANEPALAELLPD